MQKGKNTVAVALTLEIINTVKEFSSVEDQNEGFWIIKRLLTQDAEVRKRFIDKYGEEVYNETVRHYSKTNLEQRAERKLKEEEQKIKEDAKQKIEALRVETYAKQVNLAQEKGKPLSPENVKTELETIEQQLKAKTEEKSKLDFNDPRNKVLKSEIQQLTERKAILEKC